jgi:predicted RNase H-like nuclease/predicted nucleic acid-binding protein
MSGYLLDTNVVMELTKVSPAPGVLAFLDATDDLWLSSVGLHELEFGLQLLPSGHRSDILRQALADFTVEFGDRILPLGRREAEWAARLRAQARRAGHTLHPGDALLAGTARAHDLTIATRNASDFDGLDVAVTNPWGRATASPEPVTVEPAGPSPDSMLVAGVDGVRGGWVMAVTGVSAGSPVEFSVWPMLCDLWAAAGSRGLLVVAVDMPVGLPDAERRSADIEARRRLGARRSSLFWTPPLCVLDATEHAEANRLSWEHTGQGTSAQTFNLMPKVRELRATLDIGDFAPNARPRAAEVHPESSFVRLAGEPMSVGKRTPAGGHERLAVLSDEFPNIAEAAVSTPPAGPPRPALDDLLDAAAAAWTARRLAAGRAECLGEGEEDETGYPMHIWI